MDVRLAIFLFIFVAVADEVLASSRTKRQFGFNFGRPFGGNNNGGGGNNNGGGGNRQNNNNPVNQIIGQLGGLFGQFLNPNQNNNNSNQGNQGNNQTQVLGNINFGGIPVQVSSQNGGIQVSFTSSCPGNHGCQQGCRLRRGARRCYCQSGYLLRQDGRTCEDFDECSQGNNGGCNHICTNTDGSFTCSCGQGFALQSDLKTCTQGFGPGAFPSCNFNNGGCQQLCIQNGIQIQCGCSPGFSLGRDGKSCLQVDLCVENNGGCQEICSNNGGTIVCSCSPGKSLSNDGKSCLQVDPCGGNNGGCQEICSANGGNIVCSCSPGKSLGNDGKSCLQVDPCGGNNGGCQEICSANGGNIVCSCSPGKNLRNDGKRCRDINECRNKNGGCAQVCRNSVGSFKCSCRRGFTMLANGQCQANQVATTPQPTTLAPLTGCGVNSKKSLITRIVGGKPADPKDWPWMAAFMQRVGNAQYCGGTLITNRHILTAAHCMQPFQASDIFVRLGEYDFSTTNDNSPLDFNVLDIKSHENYNTRTQENDISLVTLDRTVEFNEFIQPVCLPPAGKSFAGSLGYVTGWGTIYSGGPVSNVLQEVIVPAWEPNECAAAYPNKIFPGMMCAGTKTGGKDSCQGDSGGPYLVQVFPNRRWFIAGVVSWGIGCARPENPGVYTEVTKYLDWIMSSARG